MKKCGKCGAQVDDASGFCPNCGAAVEPSEIAHESVKEPGVLRRVERNVFFRIARGFSWFIALWAALGLAASVALIVPSAAKVLGGDTSVRADEIRFAIEADKHGRSYDSSQVESGKIDPKLRARLDEAVYEIIALMPPEFQKEASIESLRQVIRNGVAPLSGTDEKIGPLRELSQLLKQFPDTERAAVLNVYFDLKLQKVAKLVEEKASASVAVSKYGFVIIAAIITITLVSMILVLLSIERNTRGEA